MKQLRILFAATIYLICIATQLYASCTYLSGFESGSLLSEPTITDYANANTIIGSTTIESTIIKSGLYSLKIAPINGAPSYWNAQPGVGMRGYLRFYVRLPILPLIGRMLVGSNKSFSNYLVINPDGTISAYYDSILLGISNQGLTDPLQWYRIEIHIDINGTYELHINGSPEISGKVPMYSAIAVQFGTEDIIDAYYIAYVDDIYVNDTYFPGEGKVILSKPIGDINRGMWTGGAGGTTGLFEAVNNIPPTGLPLNLGTNASQIQSTAKSTTDNYDLVFQNYADIGIGTGDIINAIGTYINTAEGNSTGFKSGAVALIANPSSGSESSLTFGNDQGAAGTFPSKWTSSPLNCVQDPIITFSTQPMVRVGKRTSSNKAVLVDFVGFYIDYNPLHP